MVQEYKVKKKLMIDIETRKQLFKDYSDCKLVTIGKDGEVAHCIGVVIEHVSLDKNGKVYIDWHAGAYSQLKSSEVNVVHQTMHDGCIQGIFTSKEEAISIARKWLENEKLEKIKQLEEELAELKKSYCSCNDFINM